MIKLAAKKSKVEEIHQPDVREWDGLFNSIFKLDNADYKFAI